MVLGEWGGLGTTGPRCLHAARCLTADQALCHMSCACGSTGDLCPRGQVRGAAGQPDCCRWRSEWEARTREVCTGSGGGTKNAGKAQAWLLSVSTGWSQGVPACRWRRGRWAEGTEPWAGGTVSLCPLGLEHC